MSEQSRLPIATLILIVANLAAAFALIWQPDLILEFGFNPARPTIQSVFASMFLHANLLHLLGNMVFLAAVGAAVELATGTLRFITVYLLSGLAGTLAHDLFAARNTFEPHPLVGASGCIAGCAAYYGIRYLHLRVPLAPRVGVPVVAVIAAWVALQILGAVRAIGDPMASTAFWAHLGGFVAGMCLSLVFRAPDLGHRRLGHAVLEKMNARGPAAAATAALRHLELHPDDPKALQQLIDAHHLMDDVDGEAGALVRLIPLLPDEDIGAPISRLRDSGGLKLMSPIQRMRLAERACPHDPTAAQVLYRSVIEETSEEPQRPEAMLALGGLLRESDPEAAERVLTELQQQYPLHPSVEIARTRGWLP